MKVSNFFDRNASKALDWLHLDLFLDLLLLQLIFGSIEKYS